MLAVEPVRLDSGRIIHLPAPIAGRFNLLVALGAVRRGEELRATALKDIVELEDGGLRIRDAGYLFDAYGELTTAVLLAYGGIEAYANEAIERLPDDFVLRILRDGEERRFARSELARRLSLAEKLDRVVPEVARRRSIKGLAVWADFKRLQMLRDALVHLKRRGVSTDPDEPAEFARLALGEASDVVSIAARVIEAAEPGWLPPDVFTELTQG